MNYYLLTVLPGMKQGVVDLTVVNQQNKENVLLMPPPSMYISQGIGTYYDVLLIQEELKKLRTEERK